MNDESKNDESIEEDDITDGGIIYRRDLGLLLGLRKKLDRFITLLNDNLNLIRSNILTVKL